MFVDSNLNSQRFCLDCGMAIASSVPNCRKCDAVISKQSNGQTMTYDIAHHGERVRDALMKLQDLVDELRASPTGNLRLIVGHGLIKEEVQHTLATMLFRKDILDFSQDGRNTGAFIIRLK